MRMELTEDEIAELQNAFSQETNYDSEDPNEPINVWTHLAPDMDNCLHLAARRGDLNIVKLLIKGGFDINSVGDMSCTALHYARSKDHEEIVQFLIDNGAEQNLRDEFGRFS